jgi:hypothetical protein
MRYKKIQKIFSKCILIIKLMQGYSKAPRESLIQTTKINKPTIPPKPLENSLADPSIIYMIRKTCIKLACKDILEISDVICKFDAQPIIKINSSSVMKGKWLFDKGARLTCMSTQQFKLIPKEKRPTKIMLNQREARGASGTTLIPDGDFLFPMEWNKNTVMQPVTLFKNLSSLLILGIDAIDSLEITYLSITKSFTFQEELNAETLKKADLRAQTLILQIWQFMELFVKNLTFMAIVTS